MATYNTDFIYNISNEFYKTLSDEEHKENELKHNYETIILEHLTFILDCLSAFFKGQTVKIDYTRDEKLVIFINIIDNDIYLYYLISYDVLNDEFNIYKLLNCYLQYKYNKADKVFTSKKEDEIIKYVIMDSIPDEKQKFIMQNILNKYKFKKIKNKQRK